MCVEEPLDLKAVSIATHSAQKQSKTDSTGEQKQEEEEERNEEEEKEKEPIDETPAVATHQQLVDLTLVLESFKCSLLLNEVCVK